MNETIWHCVRGSELKCETDILRKKKEETEKKEPDVPSQVSGPIPLPDLQ